MRSLGIPKPDGGVGYLSIAALAWRAGMHIIFGQLTSWVEEWAGPELLGGLKGREGTSLHDSL